LIGRWAPAVVAIALLAPASAFSQAKSGSGGNSSSSSSKSAVYEQLNLFDEAFERIRQDAVDPVGDNRLISTAIAGMLQAMDPHAVYLTPDEYKAQTQPTTEQSGSLGIVVTIENQQLEVVSPRDGSPAAAAGVKPGDQIYTINKDPTYDTSLGDIEQQLRGPVGSEVKLLLRRGTAAPFNVTVKRAADGFKTVASRLEQGDIGYIRVAGFDDKTAGDVTQAVKDLRQQANDKLIGYVIDLRNDPGGNFDAAVATADDFIDKGDIAIVKERKGDPKHIAATPGDVASGLPIVAIVNGGTARETELVAGALQDGHRAVLLGSKTFGESAIESTIPVGTDEGAIRLTTARFLTPAGHTIQGKGIEPDLAVSPLKLERLARGDTRHEADLKGALKNTDPVTPLGSGAPKPAPDKTSSDKTGSDKTGSDKTSSDKTSSDKSAPDKTAPVPGTTQSPSTAALPPGGEPAVATNDIGTADDEQLIEALDVLRGLSMTSARNTR
jgi:carboxyl-terminal processing protease